ncbi:hypothetical protein C5167_039717 [Papaver somniferum]|uniref:Uncharacterized protein n=1 Tax=Papaver somniferum TaxID=3469 RepID=A0A4Y7IGC5_PAPSO|nr:hypothetical protein C5167_039717 [Papaver somniferum]
MLHKKNKKKKWLCHSKLISIETVILELCDHTNKAMQGGIHLGAVPKSPSVDPE